MNTSAAVKSLLLLGSVQSAASVTKTSIGASVFPKFSVASDPIAPTANWQAAREYVTATGFIEEAAVKTTSTVAGHAATNAGLYVLFRMATNTTVSPTQALLPNSGATDDEKKVTTLDNTASGARSLYETQSSKNGAWQTVNVAGTGALGSKGNTLAERNKNSGSIMGACKYDTLNQRNGSAVIACPTVMCYTANKDTGDWAVKSSFIAGRLVFAGDQALDSTPAPTEGNLASADAAHADNTSKVDALKLPVLHSDIILGTFFQSYGTSTDGSTWCHNGQAAAATTLSDFSTAIDASAGTTLTVNQGFGPKGKCTFQLKAADNATFPVMQLTQATSSDMLMQVLEWYADSSSRPSVFGSNAIIDQDKAFSGGSKIADATGSTTGSMAFSKGMFFNPIRTSTEAGIINVMEAATYTWGVLTGNAVAEIPNSIGNVVYYERSTGQSSNTKRVVDSSWIMNGFAGYNQASAAYDQAVTTYETDRTAYETYVDAVSTDPSTTVVQNPGLPWPLPAFTGYHFNKCITNSAKTTLDECKDTEGWTALAGTGITTLEAYFATAAADYTQAGMANQASRATYLQVNAVTGTGALAAGKLAEDGHQVTHTFGRLGQSKATGLTGAPVILTQIATNNRAGVQISLFPEVVGSPTVWTDWTMTTANKPTISVKALAASTTDLMETSPSKTPTAVSTKTVGAQALAASIIAAASIASTLF